MVWVVPMAGVHRWKLEKAGESLAVALNEPLTLMTLKVLIQPAIGGGVVFTLEDHAGRSIGERRPSAPA